MTGGLGDSIAAFSLLMTMLALIYTAWSGAINAAATASFSTDGSERDKEKRALKPVLRLRALPFAVICWVAVIVAVPRSLSILGSIGGPFQLSRFDDIGAAFVLTQLLTLAIALSASGDAARLARHIK